jgi:uncharacterized protein (TIGR03792 family)
MKYQYLTYERRPVEVLVFSMHPSVVDEFITVDHEVWTLGEAFTPGLDRIPFLSKEVWLDDSKPGQVTLIFVWENQELWDTVGNLELQTHLQEMFDEKFPHRVELIAAHHEDSGFGIHRVTRFERIDPPVVT